MEKRGQVTLFIIVGILLVGGVVIGGVMLYNSDNNSKEIKFEDETSRFVYETIKECVYEKSIDVLSIVGVSGGRTNPDEFVSTELVNIGYGIKNGQNILPSIQDIENDIRKYLDFSLQYCLKEENFDYKVELIGDIKSDVFINQEDIEIIANIPTSIKKEGNVVNLEHPYEINLQLRLGKLHNEAEKVIAKQLEDLSYVPVSYLSDIEFFNMFSYYNDTTVIYVLTDDKSIIMEDVSYSFSYAVELNEE